MSYKTILVHLTEARRARAAVSLAARFAHRFEAHLIGLCVVPRSTTGPRRRQRSPLVAEVAAVEAAFRDATADQPFSSEFRSIQVVSRRPEQVVIEHAHAADLVLASQPDPDWEWSDVLDFPDALAIGTGRPVIVLPSLGTIDSLPRVVMVAWNGRREAARAMADALPLLKLAETVHVLTVRDARPPEDGRLPDSEIATALARHGVKANISDVLATEYTVGEEIRVRAIDCGADLLVMGCYGHSRLREMALGGVTRHMLRETTIPILFSH